jgi:hypothetical protein
LSSLNFFSWLQPHGDNRPTADMAN